MNETTYYGATYCTESGEDFGKITAIFEVADNWDGYRFHGYCRPSAEDVAAFFGQ